jgi:hypothetical protein
MYRRLEELESRLSEAQRKAAFKLQWGGKADSPDVSKDVAQQFYKTWTSRETKTKPSPPHQTHQISDNEKVELKNLFRSLAKMYHPDLVTDPEQKSWRARRMAQINQAYISDDLTALKAIADKPTEPEPSPVQIQTDVAASMRAEIKRLGGVIVDLERTLTQLVNSHTVQLMLDVSMARRVGQDLLTELANDLQAKILNMEAELESLSRI